MNNVYEQQYRHGDKVSYGTVVQLKHVFSGNYLTVSDRELSLEYGCSQMLLDHLTENCWFTIEDSYFGEQSHDNEINYSDYFYIKAQSKQATAYLHAFKKPNDDYKNEQGDDRTLGLNAGLVKSLFKAKLFISYSESAKEKKHIQSGDVIRLRHMEADSYLTTSPVEVEHLLPSFADFLKGQIRRMHFGTQIERPKGGIDRQELTDQEKQELNMDQDFKPIMVDSTYVKFLKSKILESVYIEQQESRVMFSNSCWEIQRLNPLQGGNMQLNELVRLRHVSTGKFLAVGEDMQSLVLKNSSNFLSCLFVVKSDLSGKKDPVHKVENPEKVAGDETHLHSGQRLIIQSFVDGNYLQLQDSVQEASLSRFSYRPKHINDSFKNNYDKRDSQLKLINHSYQAKDRVKMVFYIEEVSKEDAINSYNSTGVFDELLEFYSFLNVWAVSAVEQEDTTEKYYYNPD